MVNPIRTDQLLVLVPEDGADLQFAVPLDTVLLHGFADGRRLNYIATLARLLAFTDSTRVQKGKIITFSKGEMDERH